MRAAATSAARKLMVVSRSHAARQGKLDADLAKERRRGLLMQCSEKAGVLDTVDLCGPINDLSKLKDCHVIEWTVNGKVQ